MTWLRSLALLALAIACGHALLPAARATAAVNELLGVAVERSLARLGREGGYEEDASARISLPVQLGPLGRALHGTGMGERVSALEAALNRAAERATAEVGPWLREEAAGFAPAEPAAVLAGPPDAATLAFRAAVEAPLAERLGKGVEQALIDAGAPAALERVSEGAAQLPLPRRADLDLVAFTSERVRAAFFAVLAQEEAAVRAGGPDGA